MATMHLSSKRRFLLDRNELHSYRWNAQLFAANGYVVVTADGCRNLSAGLPRSSDEVEKWLTSQREAGPRLPG